MSTRQLPRSGRRRLMAAVSATTAAGLVVTGLGLAGTAARAQTAGPPRPWIISTVVGGVGGPGPGRSVAISNPCGMTSAAGRLYLASQGPVREVNERTGWLTTPAGDVSQGLYAPRHPDSGLASRVGLDACGASVDRWGDLLVADYYFSKVQVAAARTGTYYGQQMTAGHIYDVAGTGYAGISGNGGPARTTRLWEPIDVEPDRAGNLVIANCGSHLQGVPSLVQVLAVRTGRFYGQRMTAGHIYVVAGNRRTLRAGGDGGPAVKAGLGELIGQVRPDRWGNLVIADTSGNSIRVVAVRSGTFYGVRMKAGDIYSVAGDGKSGFSGDGGRATKAELAGPGGVALDGAGNLLVADKRNHRVRVVAVRTGRFYGVRMKAGDIYSVAGDGKSGFSGDGGPARAAMLAAPDAVAVDQAGNLVVADFGEQRIRVVAARTGRFYGQRMTAGDIYTVAGNGHTEFSGDGGPARRAEFYIMDGIAADRRGDMVISDNLNYRIRMVAARSGTFYGVQMRAGDVYTVAGDGRHSFSGDGVPATRSGLDNNGWVAFDHAGNLLVPSNNRVLVVAARTGTFYGRHMAVGRIYSVAGNGGEGYSGDGGPATRAKLFSPEVVAVDHAGNLVFDSGGRIRVVAVRTGTFYGQRMTAGDIYTVAGNGKLGFSGDGGPALKAEFDIPFMGAVDGAGNLVISDAYNYRIRVVAVRSGTFYGMRMKAGDIYTVAGDGHEQDSGDGGPALHAGIDINYLAVDRWGNLVGSDNSRIRVVAVRSGTFYGVPMKAGDIYTVAGNGKYGFTGDGGPATSARLDNDGIALNHAGDLLVTGPDTARVRMISP